MCGGDYVSQIRDWLLVHTRSPFQDSLRIAGDDWWRASLLQREVMLLKTWVGCKEWGKSLWVGEASPPTQRFNNISPALISLCFLSLSHSSSLSLLFTCTYTHPACSPCLLWLSPLSPLKEQRHLFMFPADESADLWQSISPQVRQLHNFSLSSEIYF